MYTFCISATSRRKKIDNLSSADDAMLTVPTADADLYRPDYLWVDDVMTAGPGRGMCGLRSLWIQIWNI